MKLLAFIFEQPSYFLYLHVFYHSVQRVRMFKPTLGGVNLVVHVQTWYQRVGIQLLPINIHELCR